MEALDLQRSRSRARYPIHPRRRGRPRGDPTARLLARQLRRRQRPGRSRSCRRRHIPHADEQTAVIESFVKSVDGKIPVIAGITLEGTKVAAEEAKRAVKAGAEAGLVYPSHGWLRFGYQKGAPQDRYRAIYQESGLPLILFQYPDATKATYNLETQLDIAALPGVFAMKNGVRNMRRWDTRDSRRPS